jgi:hypothetical protein
MVTIPSQSAITRETGHPHTQPQGDPRSEPKPTPSTRRTRPRVLLALAAAGSLIMVGAAGAAGALFLTGQEDKPATSPTASPSPAAEPDDEAREICQELFKARMLRATGSTTLTRSTRCQRPPRRRPTRSSPTRRS